MGGCEATRAIRAAEAEAAEERKPVHIIGLTAAADAASREEAFEAGMDDYLAKCGPGPSRPHKS